jgi:hypothetical protein
VVADEVADLVLRLSAVKEKSISCRHAGTVRPEVTLHHVKNATK